MCRPTRPVLVAVACLALGSVAGWTAYLRAQAAPRT